MNGRGTSNADVVRELREFDSNDQPQIQTREERLTSFTYGPLDRNVYAGDEISEQTKDQTCFQQNHARNG